MFVASCLLPPVLQLFLQGPRPGPCVRLLHHPEPITNLKFKRKTQWFVTSSEHKLHYDLRLAWSLGTEQTPDDPKANGSLLSLSPRVIDYSFDFVSETLQIIRRRHQLTIKVGKDEQKRANVRSSRQ